MTSKITDFLVQFIENNYSRKLYVYLYNENYEFKKKDSRSKCIQMVLFRGSSNVLLINTNMIISKNDQLQCQK